MEETTLDPADLVDKFVDNDQSWTGVGLERDWSQDHVIYHWPSRGGTLFSDLLCKKIPCSDPRCYSVGLASFWTEQLDTDIYALIVGVFALEFGPPYGITTEWREGLEGVQR